MKKIIKGVLCFGLLLITLSGCASNEINGDEWLLKQQEYLPSIQAFAEEMDEVYTLYIIGSISPQDFAQEVILLRQENVLVQTWYKQERDKNPIAPESNSYTAQKGIHGIESSLTVFTKILNESLGQDGSVPSREQTAYTYLSYRQELNQHISEYITAYQIISQLKGETTA